MAFIQPESLPEALRARHEHPEAVAVAGGTDVLVDINFGRLHPPSILDLTRVGEIRGWSRDNGRVRLGAGVTYHDLITRLATELPGLAMAARTVGSPPIRNRGTVGGNLGSASPAGDCHPPLLAAGAEVELQSVRGARTLPIAEFFLGPKRNAAAPDELITAVSVPVAGGPQMFCKVGTRNAMVIAVCSFALAVDPVARRVGTGIGSAGPVPLTAPDAETFLSAALTEGALWESRAPIGDEVIASFAELVSRAAQPIDDVRGSAAYRQRALSVLAARAMSWCWEQYRGGQP